MTTTPDPTFRGTPPNEKKLRSHLGDNWPLWESVVAMVKDCGATWRWIYSDKQACWGYRAYLPGDRFFVALTQGPPMEVSLNLYDAEWDAIAPANAQEAEHLKKLKPPPAENATTPSWLHVPVVAEPDLSLLAKLLFARSRRQEAPRRKAKRRR